MHIVTLPQFPVEARTEQVVIIALFLLRTKESKNIFFDLKRHFLKFCAESEATPSFFSLSVFWGKNHILEKLKRGHFPSLAASAA